MIPRKIILLLAVILTIAVTQLPFSAAHAAGGDVRITVFCGNAEFRCNGTTLFDSEATTTPDAQNGTELSAAFVIPFWEWAAVLCVGVILLTAAMILQSKQSSIKRKRGLHNKKAR